MSAAPSQTGPVALPSGPIRFNIDANASAADLSRIDPTNFAPVVAPAGAVTLRQPFYAQMIGDKPVIRRLNLAQIKANQPVAFDTARLDLSPVLKGKGALPLVAERLMARPNLGVVKVQDIQLTEIREGMVVHSFLNYQLKPGACSGSNRGQVEALGIHCVKRMGLSDAELAAAYADPNNVHYVRDPRARMIIVTRAKADSARQQTEVMQEVANFRASLNGGAGRQALLTQLGDPEMKRLAAMNDDDLAAELINTAENKVEQVAFVPRPNAFRPIDKGALSRLTVTLPPPPPAPPPPPQPVVTDTPLAGATYLTGFTLGKDYEWSYTVEKTIKWCYVGCAKHYYAHAYAHLSYGFGLRFPIAMGGNYHYNGTKLADGKTINGSATVTPTFAPFNGGPSDYLSTGLPADKVFDGKELVAEATAGAGFDAHIPIYPDPPALHIEVGKDFTDLLPKPFAGGNMVPPAKGQQIGGPFIFQQFDLLGGRLNFGIVGAQIFPAVDIGLHADALSFRLRDNILHVDTPLTESGQAVKVGVDSNQRSDFDIDQPLYKLGFTITPGIDARLFVDLGVWGHVWDFPLFFPALTIEIPQGGVEFGCHDGTHCGHNWKFVTKNGATTGGGVSDGPTDEEIWGQGFDKTWLPQCLDDTCQFAVKLVRLGTVIRLTEIDATKPKDAAAQIDKAHNGGAALAATLVKESQARKTAQAADGWSVLAQAVWTKQCKDMDCPAEISAIARTMGPRAKQLQAQNSDLSSLNVVGMVSKEVGPKFQAAIDRSTARAGVDSIGVLALAVWTKQCLDNLCKTNVKLLSARMSAEARANQKADPDMSPLELTKSVSVKYGKLFQQEIDASKVRTQH